MRKTNLGKAVSYSNERGKSRDLSIETYVTTDNLLQNRSGIKEANSLPSVGDTFAKYSKEDILVSNIRPYLKKIWFAEREGLCSSDVLVFSTRGGFASKFIYYCLFQDEFFDHMMKGSKGTKMPRGDKNQILNFEIPDIPLNTQIKISEVLAVIDEKIALNDKINDNLEKMAKMLYDYWFVQFDFPDENGRPYRSSGGKMVLDPKTRSKIPGKWNVESLEQIGVEVIRGVTYSNENIRQGADKNVCGILRATNITGNKIDTEGLMYVDETLVSDRQRLKPMDIVMVMSSGSKDHIGKNGFYHYSVPNSYGAFCSKISIDQQYKLLVAIYLQTSQFRTYIINNCLGTNINNLTNSHICEIHHVMPDKPTLDLFNVMVTKLYGRINSNTRENHQLATLRDWLLPMLMNGQVKVG